MNIQPSGRLSMRMAEQSVDALALKDVQLSFVHILFRVSF